MKKFLMPLIIGMCSCASEHSELLNVDEDAKIVKVGSADMNVDGPESRWAYDENNKFGWKSNDVLGIFPVGKGSQLEFPVDLKEGQTSETVDFDGGGWGFRAGYSYSAYSPYNLLSTKGNQIKFSYAKQCRIMDGNSFDLRENMFRVTPPTSVVNGTIFFLFYNTEAFLKMELYGLLENKTYKSVTLYADDKVIPQEKEYDIFSMRADGTSVTITDKVLSVDNHLTMDLNNATLDSKGKILLWMAVPAIGTEYGSFKVVVKDSEDNIYVGEPLDNKGNSFKLSLNRNKRMTMVVNLKQNNGAFSADLEGWKTDDVEYSGEAE